MSRKSRNGIESIKKEIPIARYDKKLQCFQKQDGSYLDIYQIIPKDLVNGDIDEIEMDCFTWAKFYKTYGMDLQIVSMMFPCDTSKQQKYWEEIRKKNENPVFEPMIERKLSELKYRERHTVKKEFFLMFFWRDEDEIRSGRETADTTMGIRRPGVNSYAISELLEEIPEEKKRQILFKFANKTSQIF